MYLSNELQIGKAGEYMVCADLIQKGFVAFPSEQGLPYDVVLDTGNRMFRVQVKTTTKYKSVPQRVSRVPAYIFHVKRAGKGGKREHQLKDLDIYALVCLDTRKVGYLLNGDMPRTLSLRVDSLRGTYHDEKAVKDFEKVNEIKHLGVKYVSEQTGLDKSEVYRMLRPGYKPHLTKCLYFSDLERNSEWFLSL